MMPTPAPRARDPSAADWANAARFEFVREAMDLVRSHAVSAIEAAWREERMGTEMHLASARRALVEAIQTFKELE